jgi:hypothetical protein
MSRSQGLTFSSGANAFGLLRSAALEGVPVRTTDGAPLLPLPSAPDAIHAEWLFFTEEASLGRALQGELSGAFLPRHFPAALLDDKWALAEWLASYPDLLPGLRQWPLASPGAPYPCLVKARRSWLGARKLPRGWVCRDAEAHRRAIERIDALGLDRSLFFVQEWLGDAASRLVSVCGFHDAAEARRRLVAVVERLEASEPGLSCSAAVATVEDAWGLRERAWAILDRLSFTGPFEIEFLVLDDRVLVLELNPRFWLQHTIFIPHGNGVIRRYLGIDCEADWRRDRIDGVLWVDGLHLARVLLRLRLGVAMRLLRHRVRHCGRLQIWPPLGVSLASAVRRRLGRLRRTPRTP